MHSMQLQPKAALAAESLTGCDHNNRWLAREQAPRRCRPPAMAPVFSAMGAGHAAMLIIWNALQLLGCAGCAYSELSASPQPPVRRLPTLPLLASRSLGLFLP